jgi:hypothetical protein
MICVEIDLRQLGDGAGKSGGKDVRLGFGDGRPGKDASHSPYAPKVHNGHQADGAQSQRTRTTHSL